jgi:hypothetical protein
MQRISNRDRGELTDEEERALRDPSNWDWEHAERYDGTPHPIIVFRVEIDHERMAHLAAVSERDPQHPNLADLVQRWVDERLAAEAAALSIDEPDRATRSA